MAYVARWYGGFMGNGEYKQGELLDLSVFPDDVRNEVDDNWGEPIDFTIEEILDIDTDGEIQTCTGFNPITYKELSFSQKCVDGCTTVVQLQFIMD